MRVMRWAAGVGVILLLATRGMGQPSVPCSGCTAPENGGGTADFPALCPYEPCCGNTMHIVDGLPAGTTIEVQAALSNFTGVISVPGGPMGGETVNANATLAMQMTGTGVLAGFSRFVMIPVTLKFENAARTPLAIVQPFDGYLAQHQGQIVGDPDFDLLRITAGDDFGMPSPGHTTFSQSGFDYSVESFFDITYRIDFIGAPAGSLAGMSGSTTDQIRLYQGCPRWRPGDAHKMHFPQHPDEKGWDVLATWPHRLADDWTSSETGPVKDLHFWGSFLNGQREPIKRFYLEIYSDVPAGVDLPYSHPGTLLWADTVEEYVMTPLTPGVFEGWYDPFAPGYLMSDHNEYWQYDVLLEPVKWFSQTVGTVYWLSISAELADTTAGRRWGWKSTLDHYNDDGVYRPLPPAGTCVAPDNGFGTATQPAICPFDNNDLMYMIDGLPPLSTVEFTSEIHSIGGVVETPGGGLGGTQSQFFAQLQLKMNGTGAYFGYTRTVNMLLPNNMIHTAPRAPFTSPQSFATDLIFTQGQITGDPDFDLLRITAGTGFGMPSPGNTTLTQAGAQWNVQSFFDITYRIDFVGASTGPFAGRSGSTTGTARIRQGGPIVLLNPWIDLHEPPVFTTSLDLSFVITGGTGGCCVGTTGNVDCDPANSVDIGDLTTLIDNLFVSFTPLCCVAEANCDGIGGVDIGDLTALIDNLFLSFTPLPSCP